MENESPSSQLLTDYTLKRVWKLVRGNGIAQNQIKLIESDEKIYDIEASAFLTPHIAQTQKQVKGPPHFRPDYTVENASQLDIKAAELRQDQNFIERILRTGAEKIKKEDNFGWGNIHDNYELHELAQTLCCSEKCGLCSGDGKQSCAACQGHKNINCTSCHGKGDQRCIQCGGSGKILGAGGDAQVCTLCSGRSFIPCRTCQGRKVLPCPKCYASGKVPCGACDGSGIVSILVTLVSSICSLFKMDDVILNAMPAFASKTIKKFSNQFAKRDIAAIEVTNERNENGGSKIEYHARLPLARSKIAIADQTYDFIALGNQPILDTMPVFMDAVAALIIQTLQKAETSNHPLHDLIEAKHFSIVQNALRKCKNATQLCKLYQGALSDNCAQQIYKSIHIIKKRLSFMPRLVLGIAGIVVSGVIFALHFWHGRQNPMPFKGSDLKCLVIAVFAQYLLVQIGSSLALQFSLSKAEIKNNHFLAPFGKMGTASLAGVVVIYLLIVAIGFATSLFSFT